jgi:hypothetical protein
LENNNEMEEVARTMNTSELSIVINIDFQHGWESDFSPFSLLCAAEHQSVHSSYLASPKTAKHMRKTAAAAQSTNQPRQPRLTLERSSEIGQILTHGLSQRDFGACCPCFFSNNNSTMLCLDRH